MRRQSGDEGKSLIAGVQYSEDNWGASRILGRGHIFVRGTCHRGLR